MNESVNWEKVGAIAGVIGVLIALGAWLVPKAADFFPTRPSEAPTVTPTSSPTYTPVVSTTTLVPPTDTPTPISPTPTLVPPTEMPISSAPPGMAYVPAGEFIRGSTDADVDSALVLCNEEQGDCERSWFEDEQPQHTVYLEAFYIDKTEVANVQYRACVEAGACDLPGDTSYYDNTDYAQHPVVFVSWNDADAYCRWAGKRLPTEAEWEKAARGTDGRVYPWGNSDPDCNKANYRGKDGDCVGNTTTVGSYSAGASPYGALDMAGNVWEWVADWYDSGYYSQSPARNPAGPNSGVSRVLRGGSWGSDCVFARCASRGGYGPVNWYVSIGFRCARSSH